MNGRRPDVPSTAAAAAPPHTTSRGAAPAATPFPLPADKDQPVSNTTYPKPGNWPGPMVPEPHLKLSQLCDADHRQLHPTTKALAVAVLVGDPLPDPYQQRNQFRAVLDAARAYLQEEPSPRSIRAAGHRLSAAIAQLSNDMAKKEGD